MKNQKEIDITERKKVNIAVECIECGHTFSNSVEYESQLDINYSSATIHCPECEKTYNYETQTINQTLEFCFLDEEDVEFQLNYFVNQITEPEDINADYCYKNAFKFYKNQLKNLNAINAIIYEDKLIQQTSNRLVFSGIISSFETYVKEVIYYLILRTYNGLRCFVENYKQYKNEKILLEEIFRVNDTIQDRVTNDLDKLSFHNIPLVISLFKIYEIDISKFKYKEEANTAVRLRHDIVHRSGVNYNNSLIIISKEEIKKTMVLFDEFVKLINAETNYSQTKDVEFPF